MAEPRERSVILRPHEVRATLDGRQTQFRRLIVPQPNLPDASGPEVDAAWQSGFVDVRCPFGVPGDRLWVRETWHPDECVCARAGFRSSLCKFCHGADLVVYRADTGGPLGVGWFSSTQMPRWASRLLLEVVEVRVQKLTDITVEDAQAEGCYGAARCDRGRCGTEQWPEIHFGAGDDFKCQWDATHDKRAPWSSSPWVWAVSFKVVSRG